VAEPAPAGTVTVAGTGRFVLLEVVTATGKAAGLACDSVMVQVVVPIGFPVPCSSAEIACGLHVSDDTRMESVRLKEAELPNPVAVMAAFWVFADSVPDCAVKAAELDPAGTVSDAGTARAATLLASENVWLARAAPFKLAVQVVVEEFRIMKTPLAAGKVQVTEERVIAGTTLRAAVFEEPAREAVKVTDCVLATETVEAVNVVEEVPAAMVTVAGSDAAAELSVSVTTAPPAGAAPERMIVHVLGSVATTVAGAHATEDRVGDTVGG
jgi:hypothetical protein